MSSAGLPSLRWRSQLAACVGHVLDLDPGTVVVPAGGDPFVAWRGWLAARGLGLVPIADVRSFGWPGVWIASLVAPGREPTVRVMFGVPSGPIWPDDDLHAEEQVVEGWVVASLRPDAPSLAGAPGGAVDGRVVALFAAATVGAALRAHERVEVTQTGVRGDRYERGRGTFSHPEATGTALTLVTAEALADAVGATDPDGWALARRNVVTHGVDLDALVGRRFAVGEVECFGSRPCEPCARLQRLWRPGVLRALVHRGGLRADVLVPGEIAVGARIRAVPVSDERDPISSSPA